MILGLLLLGGIQGLSAAAGSGSLGKPIAGIAIVIVKMTANGKVVPNDRGSQFSFQSQSFADKPAKAEGITSQFILDHLSPFVQRLAVSSLDAADFVRYGDRADVIFASTMKSILTGTKISGFKVKTKKDEPGAAPSLLYDRIMARRVEVVDFIRSAPGISVEVSSAVEHALNNDYLFVMVDQLDLSISVE